MASTWRNPWPRTKPRACLKCCSLPSSHAVILAGKLLGVGSAGLTQLGIWVGCLLFFNATSLAASLIVGGLAAYGVTPLQLIFFVLYFLLGFFLYSAMSAGLGATVSQESEVQQFSIVIILPLVLAISLIVYILGNPSAWQVVLLSLFPPLTPIVMCLRMSAMTVPWWQLALSLVLMAASIYGMLSLVIAHLPHRHPHVRQAPRSAGDDSLAAVQLSRLAVDFRSATMKAHDHHQTARAT